MIRILVWLLTLDNVRNYLSIIIIVWMWGMISKGNHVIKVCVLCVVFHQWRSKNMTAVTFFFVQCIIKQLFDSVFVISRKIKVLVSYQPQPWLQLITPTSTMIILDMTSPNNNILFIMSLAEGWGYLWNGSSELIRNNKW